MYDSVKGKSWFDYLCDVVLLIFLSVLLGYGPDRHRVFIPVEILFVLTFGIRFLVKKSKVTNAFVLWTFGFLLISGLSIFYANDKIFAFSRFKSVIQVLVFGNLILPYVREGEESYHRFLSVSMLAVLFVFIRLLIHTPFDRILFSRLGYSIQINPNTIGYLFSLATLVALYFALQQQKGWYLLLVPILLFLTILSGSRKTLLLLAAGMLTLFFFQQSSLKRSLAALGGGIALVIIGILALIVIPPLKRSIGQRYINMLATLLGGNVDVSTSIRMGMIQTGFQMVMQKPIFGWGLGAFTDLGGFETYAHNNYVELLVAVGIVGTIVYYSLCFYIVVASLTRLFRSERKGPYVLSVTLMMAMLLDQVGRVTYNDEYTTIIIALCYAGVVLDKPDLGLDLWQFFKKIAEFVVHPSRFINHLLKMRVARLLPDAIFLKIKYRMSIGRTLSLSAPETYNEKLQWQKIYDRNPLYPKLVDKYEIREFVTEKIGKAHLVPLIGVYDKPEEIDLTSLPNRFVLKPTHTSGDVLFCYDKNTFDWDNAIRLMNRWLSTNYFWYNREWVYKEIKPRILIEEFIKTDDNLPPKDYKIFCFDGVPKLAFVASDRPDETKFDFFGIEWNRLELKQHYPNSTYEILKPSQWEDMLDIARALSAGLPQVRVDLYVDVDGDILFGELTLFHFSGFEPLEPASYDDLLGSWIQLPVKEI